MDAIGAISSSRASFSFGLSTNGNIEGEKGKEKNQQDGEVKIKDNHDGSYTVTKICNGQIVSTEKVTKSELLSKYSSDVTKQCIDLQGTNSAQEAQQKYGSSVANNFFAIA